MALCVSWTVSLKALRIFCFQFKGSSALSSFFPRSFMPDQPILNVIFGCSFNAFSKLSGVNFSKSSTVPLPSFRPPRHTADAFLFMFAFRQVEAFIRSDLPQANVRRPRPQAGKRILRSQPGVHSQHILHGQMITNRRVSKSWTPPSLSIRRGWSGKFRASRRAQCGRRPTPERSAAGCPSWSSR